MSPLKQLILAIYNPVVNQYRHAWKWLRTGISQFWTFCQVCGRTGPKRFAAEAVPDKLIRMWGLTQSEAHCLRVKETMICPWCGSKYRGRRLAQTLITSISLDEKRPISLKVFSRSQAFAKQKILILNWIDGLSEILANLPNVTQTEYFDGVTPGDLYKGVRHEDAQSLTFDDATFDIAISSETLEHIPDLNKALNEIHRVLRSSGKHLFTIPLKPGVEKTEKRATLDTHGEINDLLLPRLHHPAGDRGWPVFTEFGADFPEILRNEGLTVVVDNQALESDDTQNGSNQSICPVFIVARL